MTYPKDLEITRLSGMAARRKFCLRTVFHVFHRVGFMAAALALTGPASAQEHAEEVAETEALPEGVSYLLVELLGEAKMIGYPAVCPGSSPDDDPAEIVCMAELYEAPARVIQTVAGEKTKRRLNIRFTAHSFHAVWKKGRRFLLAVRPFNDKGRKGHFAFSWDWENEDGEFCVGNKGLDDADPAWRDFYRGGRVFTVGANDPNWSEGWELACVTGRRPREP